MIALNLEESLRIKPAGETRIACLSGVVWVTRQGDLRDFILSHGDHLDVGRGLTMITALEPTVISITKRKDAFGREILKRLRSVMHWIDGSPTVGELRSGSASNTLSAPYY